MSNDGMKKLKQLVMQLGEGIPAVDIGIMGSEVQRDGDGPTNAEIGAIHEFGTSKHPQRSFLFMPILQHFTNNLNKSGILDDKTVERIFNEGGVKMIADLIALVGLETVQEAFDTGGFGEWAQHKGSYKNNTGQILVDTQQLRRSITTRVGEPKDD